MNRKSIIRMIIVLALSLCGGVGEGLLSSCRTKTQCINNASVDSLAFHQKDSVGTKIDFSFDRMIITTLGQLLNPTLDQFLTPTLDQQSSTVTPSRNKGREGNGVRGSSVLIIENGHLTTISDSKSTTDTDLKSVKAEKKQVRIRSEPNRLNIFLLIVFCVFILIIYRKCSS